MSDRPFSAQVQTLAQFLLDKRPPPDELTADTIVQAAQLFERAVIALEAIAVENKRTADALSGTLWTRNG